MSAKPEASAAVAALALAAGLLMPAAGVLAQEPEPSGQGAATAAGEPAAAPESAADELARRATDPTASPPSFAGIGEWGAAKGFHRGNVRARTALVPQANATLAAEVYA